MMKRSSLRALNRDPIGSLRAGAFRGPALGLLIGFLVAALFTALITGLLLGGLLQAVARPAFAR